MIATASMPLWKKVLAGIGAAYLLAMAAWVGYTLVMNATSETGASNLAAHPERQDEILAQRRAADLRDRLDLSAEQHAQIEALYLESAARLKAAAASGEEQTGMRGFIDERMKMQESLKAILTPEQFEKYIASLPKGPSRGRPGERDGRGGPGGPGNPREMIERLKKERPELAGRIEEIEKLPEEQRRDAFRELMREVRPGFGDRRQGPPTQ